MNQEKIVILLNGIQLAKSYCYTTGNGKIVIKIKGFTLNHENSLKHNREIMSEIISKEQTKIQLNYKQITRNEVTKDILNKPTEKECKMNYNERVILKENNEIIETLPYGFKNTQKRRK